MTARAKKRPAAPRQPEDPTAVLQLPAACGRCGGDFELAPGSEPLVRQIDGVILDFAYSAVLWERSRCTSCGQAAAVRTYFRDSPGKKSNAAP